LLKKCHPERSEGDRDGMVPLALLRVTGLPCYRVIPRSRASRLFRTP
jgi:hypothetical protein